jgi:uncharacterized protein
MSEEFLEPLTDEEMNELDRFLLDRVDESTCLEGQDEGLLGLSELDGFFTAIASGPELILPSEWMPAIWGDQDPVWATPADFERIFLLLTRHYNGVINALMAADFEFEPIFNEREVDGERYTIVDEWCVGYMRGVSLCPDAWDGGGDRVFELLQPILLFSGEPGWEVLDELDDETVRDLQAAIPGAVRDIHRFWLTRQGYSEIGPIRVNTPDQLRDLDAPCACGSGKPYRKCCLH